VIKSFTGHRMMAAVALAAIISGGLLIWLTTVGGDEEGFNDPGFVEEESAEVVDEPTTTEPSQAQGGDGASSEVLWPPDASQSESDAGRDMVNPAIARLSFSERVDSIASVNAGGKRWILSELPTASRNQMVDDGLAGADLDPFGGEILLVAEDVIVQAFPLNQFPPTFLETDGVMVFGGRDGDGGYPDSALIGINSLTLDSARVVMVSDLEGASPVYGSEWSQGSPDQLRQLQDRDFLKVLRTLTGTLDGGDSWVVRDDPNRGLCAAIANINYGCDDERDFVAAADPEFEPRIIALPVPPEGIDHDLIGVIVHGHLPDGASNVEIRVAGAPLDFEPSIDVELGLWVLPASVPDEPFTLAFFDEAGALVVEWVE
jgi:hypothetical protein